MKIYVDFENYYCANGEVVLYMSVQHIKIPNFESIIGMEFGCYAKLGGAHTSAFRFRTLTNDGVK